MNSRAFRICFRAGLLALVFYLSALLPVGASAKELRVLVSSTSFAWLPLYVADGAGFFTDEGLNVSIVVVKDGAVVITAILSGDGDIAGIGANSMFAARFRNQPIRLLVPMNAEFTSTIFGRADYFAKKGITSASSIEAKVEALKGSKIGVVNINSGVHLVFRSLMQSYGKADLDKVAEVVPVGDATPTLAALGKGLIDATAFSPPVPQRAMAEGNIMILLDPIRGEIPETKGMVFTALAVGEPALKAKASELESFVRAIDRANKLVHSNPEQAGAAARKHLGNMADDLYRAGIAALAPAIPSSPEVSIAGLKTYYALLRSGGEKYAQGDFDFENSVANDLVRRATSKKP